MRMYFKFFVAVFRGRFRPPESPARTRIASRPDENVPFGRIEVPNAHFFATKSSYFLPCRSTL
ncbi:MAG TPA: hypothetical protein DCW71_07515 [Alistipes sp.]|nr:hypothetical protein [Alistipes sp.]